MERDSLHDEWTDDYAEEPKTPRTTPAPFQTSDKYVSHVCFHVLIRLFLRNSYSINIFPGIILVRIAMVFCFGVCWIHDAGFCCILVGLLRNLDACTMMLMRG